MANLPRKSFSGMIFSVGTFAHAPSNVAGKPVRANFSYIAVCENGENVYGARYMISTFDPETLADLWYETRDFVFPRKTSRKDIKAALLADFRKSFPGIAEHFAE